MDYLSRISAHVSLPCILATLLAMSLTAAQAQMTSSEVPVVLGRGAANTQVTNADVLSELRRASPANRETFLSKPDMVQQMANNLLVRRVLAAQAQDAQLDKDPVLAATLAVARDRVLSDARLAQLDAKATPSDAALDTYARNIYQANPAKFDKPAETRARHILLPKDGAESLQKAKDLLAQLRAGASFEDLAKTHSTDAGSAAKGGDLGFFTAGKMVKPFEEAVDKLTKPGELSEPVETQFGYHIIRLEERKEKTSRPYTEVQEQLKSEALAGIVNESRAQLVNELNKDFVFDSAAIGAMGKALTK
jgi:peptidyl-prolyl cis-trans isomerase C